MSLMDRGVDVPHRVVRVSEWAWQQDVDEMNSTPIRSSDLFFIYLFYSLYVYGALGYETAMVPLRDLHWERSTPVLTYPNL